MEWVWPLETVVRAIHGAQLAEHGGGTGLRDEGLLKAALARPQTRWDYDQTADAACLAALYAAGIVRNHPFVDGNKRTAFVVMLLFLSLNGWDLTADDADCVNMIEALAAGTLTEPALETWIRNNLKQTNAS